VEKVYDLFVANGLLLGGGREEVVQRLLKRLRAAQFLLDELENGDSPVLATSTNRHASCANNAGELFDSQSSVLQQLCALA